MMPFCIMSELEPESGPALLTIRYHSVSLGIIKVLLNPATVDTSTLSFNVIHRYIFK